MYIHIETLAYPLTASDIIARHPNTSFCVPFVAPKGYADVAESAKPDFNAVTHEVIEVAPAPVAGIWTRQWEVVALTTEQATINAQAAAQDVLRQVRDSAQARLDAFAQSRRYDDIVSLASYAVSKDPKRAEEGQRGVDLRDAVWDALIAIEVAVMAGQRAVPTVAAALAELPAITWDE